MRQWIDFFMTLVPTYSIITFQVRWSLMKPVSFVGLGLSPKWWIHYKRDIQPKHPDAPPSTQNLTDRLTSILWTKKIKRTVKRLAQKYKKAERQIRKLRAAVERQRLAAVYDRAQRKAWRAMFRDVHSRNQQLEYDNRQLQLQLQAPVGQERERQE